MASEITRANSATIKVAIIPTGSFFRGQLQNIKDVEWCIPTESGKMIAIDPKTTDYSSLMKISFGYGAINSPEILAEMLYNAIFIDNIDYISITGGRDNEFVIIKLNELIKTRKPIIPEKLPIVYGMSDATNTLIYLGQRGYARPFVAGGIFIGQISKMKLQQSITRPNPTYTDDTEGISIPEYSLRTRDTLSQTMLFDDKVNFLLTEIHFRDEANLMKEFYGKIPLEKRKNIVFCMSAVGGTSIEECDKYLEKKLTDSEKEIISSILKREVKIEWIDSEQHFVVKAKGHEDFTLSKESGNKIEEISSKIRHNQQKQEEQDKFKNWCLENGFNVIEGINFGHRNNQDQYQPIPCFCQCKLEGEKISYTLGDKPLIPTLKIEEFMFKPTEEISESVHYLKFCGSSSGDEAERLRPNYIGGGGSEVSMFLESNGNKTSIFEQKGRLQPDKDGTFNIYFYGIESRGGAPEYNYIVDLERLLKDIDKLKMKGLKTLKIVGFNLPLDEKIKLDNGEKAKPRKILEDILFFMKENYPTFKEGVEIEINGKSLEEFIIKSEQLVLSKKTRIGCMSL